MSSHAYTSDPSVSVIVPTFNGGDILPEFFAALQMQTLTPDQILVGDSQSDDNSADVCRNAGAEVITIRRDEFDHGGTRSFLAKKATCAILVFLTQDAILVDRGCLQKIVDVLTENPSVACAYGRQLPAHNATLLSAHLRKFNYPEVSEIREFSDRTRLGLKTIFISNSFAAYKKQPLQEQGFFKNGLIFGEDTCTLGRLLREGYKVAYVADSAVYHSHNYDITDEFKRSFDIGVLHSSERWLLDTFGSAEGIGGNYVRASLQEIMDNKRYLLIFDWVMRMAAKFSGYKLGRLYRQLPSRLRPKLSLHPRWWTN